MFFNWMNLSLVDFLKINNVDLLFINNFKSMNVEEKSAKIEKLVAQNRFGFIVKMACVDSAFMDTCLLPLFDKTWAECWSTMGVIITKNFDKAFYDQETQPKFNLFLGAWFYHMARISANTQEDCTALEIPYLKKAISFNSIHACQRYNQFLYFNISKEDGYFSETEKLFKEIIYQIKQFLPQYGAYGYLMLTEAYTRYGYYMLNVNENFSVDKICSAALEACQQGKTAYQADDPIVFNASFGGTIADSNTMYLSDFNDIESYITKIFKRDMYVSSSKEQQSCTISFC